MVTILPALRQVREDLAAILDRGAIERHCEAVGHRWRDRKLTPADVLHLFILQILHNNTAMTHLPCLAGARFTTAAYCRARRRLPLALFERLVAEVGRQAQRSDRDMLWHGHRVYLEDGSGFSMPDTPALQAHFGQPDAQRPGCGFPVAHMLCLLDGHGGFIRDVKISPYRTHDMAHASALHPALSPGDVLVGDRAFCSYAHLALVSQRKLHGLFRVHQRQIVSFHPHRPSANEVLGSGHPTSRWIQRLGTRDQLVKWRKPQSPPRWMTEAQFDALPDELLLRELKCRIIDKAARVREITLVTTLLDAEKYPARALAELYRRRWQIEVDFRDLKITLGMDVLKGKSVDVVLKEAYVFILVYNLIRTVMAKAGRRQKVPPYRISFIAALRWLRPPEPRRDWPTLIVNPSRPGRHEPRCRKRRMKQYDLMNRPRDELRKRLKKQRKAA